jgi:hypothetical protein
VDLSALGPKEAGVGRRPHRHRLGAHAGGHR